MPTLRTEPSPRQSKADEVKRLHKAGLTPRQIASALDLSTQGVWYHLKRFEAQARKKAS